MSGGVKLPRLTLAGLALVGGFFALYFLAVAPSAELGSREGWEAYGEVPVGPPIEQPFCFWTNLGFIAVGLWSLYRFDRLRGAGQRPSRASAGLALLTLWMGPASMLEHGTLSTVWGWFDASSIHWLALFLLGSLAVRARPRSVKGRALLLTALVAFGVAIGVWTFRFPQDRDLFTRLLLASTVIAFAFAFAVGVLERAAIGAFAGAAGAFALGGLALASGARGGATAPWGHGVWHLCGALALWCLVRLLSSDRPRAGEQPAT